MPSPAINMEDIFKYMRKHDNLTEEEEDDLMAEFIAEYAKKDIQVEERRHVFMGKARAKKAKRK